MIKIWTKPIHNKKLCVNPNFTSSQLRGMCQLKHHMFISKRYVPIKNWDNMKPHILYSNCFLFEFNLSNLLCLKAFLLIEESNCILSPSPLELPRSNFSMPITHLQFLNIYFIMEKIKFTTMVTPNTLETMIEYTWFQAY